MKKTIVMAAVAMFVSVLLSSVAVAQELEGDDLSIFGLEVEKLLNLGSGMLATILCGLTVAAYRRTDSSRLLYVGIAFFLFAVKGFLTSLELLSIDLTWVDPTSSFLNFAILLCFFAGIVKK